MLENSREEDTQETARKRDMNNSVLEYQVVDYELAGPLRQGADDDERAELEQAPSVEEPNEKQRENDSRATQHVFGSFQTGLKHKRVNSEARQSAGLKGAAANIDMLVDEASTFRNPLSPPNYRADQFKLGAAEGSLQSELIAPEIKTNLQWPNYSPNNQLYPLSVFNMHHPAAGLYAT